VDVDAPVCAVAQAGAVLLGKTTTPGSASRGD
jgi:hypothetical protein